MENNEDNKEESESQNIKDTNKGNSYTVIKSSKELNIPLFEENIIGKKTPNYIQRESPLQSVQGINLNFIRDIENDNAHNIISSYIPLTPQIIPKEQRHLNKKYFPSKEDVCKGNPDYSQKVKIPSSSPITRYFNMDNAFNKDFGFTLENPNATNFQETPSNLSNSHSDMFDFSPSIFFNKGTSNEIGKNYEENPIVEQGQEEYKNKNGKDEGDELYSVPVDSGNSDTNYKDDGNIILSRINELRNKKNKDKNKGNNNLKKQKNNINKKTDNKVIKKNVISKEKEENKTKEINKLNEKKEEKNNNSFEKSEDKLKNNQIDLNIFIMNNANANTNKTNEIKVQHIEEDSPAANISPEFTKKIEEYFDYDESPLILNKEVSKDFQDIKDKKIFNDNKNIIDNSNILNNNMDNNDKMRSNINNLPNNNVLGMNNPKNLNYISGMNINCTNLNINNFTNLNQIDQGNNLYKPNQQYFIKNKNNKNNMIYNDNLEKNPIINNIYGMNNYQNNMKNINNYEDNSFNNMKKMNYMEPFNTQYNLSNNINPGYQFIQNNNPQINKNMDFSKKKNYTNPNLNYNPQNNQNNDKRKKIKKLEISFYMNKSLIYLAQNIYILGKDQGACRYIQKLISDNPSETLLIFYDSICDNILDLINDQFGNYLIQKIIIYSNEEQLINILKLIAPKFFEICCNNHGTRALQKFIDYSKTVNVKNYFYFLLKPLITPLLKELKGTFIVQKFADVHREYSNDINQIIVENSPDLATHRHGCCVIQKYLEIRDPIMTPHLLDKLIDNCLLLIVDQFGNYVIQTILLMGIKKYGNKLAEKIAQNVVYYAKHKYSSNVVEKCFDHCDGNYLRNLMYNVQKKENLRELILDEHGNYVVQKVLLLSEPNTQKDMLKIIVPLFEKLKAFPYGERVINKLYTMYPIIADKNYLNDNI